MVNTIGIDGGVNGGIVVLDENKQIIFKTIMPAIGKTRKEFDIKALYIILRGFFDADLIIEKAQPRYRDGSKSAFKTGFGYAVLQSLAIALHMPYRIVPAKEWQQHIFKSKKVENTKTSSIVFCKKKWKDEKWLRTPRCQNEHDGMTDAACIAYYGLITKEADKK